jgi:hypothetical protein
MLSDAQVHPAAADEVRWLYRVGGLSALALGIAYIVTIPLYLAVGAPPNNGAAWLEYSAGKTSVWWAILGLSVLTDLLFVPVGLALYYALQFVNRNLMLFGTALVALFVVLDLAVTWSNYAALIALGSKYAAAASETQRMSYVGAAEYASAVLTSTIEAVYSIGTLSLGILLIGCVMLRSMFGRGLGYLGIVTGVLGIAFVVGSLVSSALGVLIIFTSVLTTAWVLLVGHRLYRIA